MFKKFNDELYVNFEHVLTVRATKSELYLTMINGELINIPLADNELPKIAALKLVTEANQAKARLAAMGVRQL